ncbi:MAG: hypothetical protein E7350_01130, partial [Clostridiales bacterium]|nr:hypothetical protein [Clostridiales bacterium]
MLKLQQTLASKFIMALSRHILDGALIKAPYSKVLFCCNMDIIVSEDNKLYKRASKLKDKKYRDESAQYLIEGLRGIIDTPDEDIEVIIAREGFCDTRINESKVVYFSQKLFGKLCLTENTSGVMAIASQRYATEFVSDYVIYLDRIRDPGNMGTIIRTAVA